MSAVLGSSVLGRESAAKILYSDGPAAFLQNVYIPKDLPSLLLILSVSNLAIDPFLQKQLLLLLFINLKQAAPI